MEDRRSDSQAEALIADLAAHSAELSTMLHESVAALAELLATHPPADGDGPDGGAGPLARDVLEIATLQAQAAGVSVEAYLRAAVLAYAGRPDPPAGEGEADDPERPRRARDEARRLRTESQAVKAQIKQAASRAARAKTDEDGGPPPKR